MAPSLADFSFEKDIFILPAVVFLLVLCGLAGMPFGFPLAIVIGLLKNVVDSAENIREGRYSLDYIAFIAMVVSLYSGEYFAGAVIAFMFTGGEALEAFASDRAHTALKALGDTIPKDCWVWQEGRYVSAPIQTIKNGQRILIKRNEIVPLDGTIFSPAEAMLDMANLTGEVDTANLEKGTLVKSGSVNVGETIELLVVGDFSSSAYHKIVTLVEDAKAHPARMVSLSERANLYFTLITFLIAGAAYFSTGDIVRLLAVLVVATPCPLIIAAPVAFVSGMSRTARSGIILRRPAAFEAITNATMVFFDKTGTLTLGQPVLSHTEIVHGNGLVKSEEEALAVAAGVEIHSLHPLGRTIVAEAVKRHIQYVVAETPLERIGHGVSGVIHGVHYELSRAQGDEGGIVLALLGNAKEVVRFYFTDVLKPGAVDIISTLKKKGVRVAVITGDKAENAGKVFKDVPVEVYANQSPEDKHRLVDQMRTRGETVVMVGDGLNDAPALARAHVGIVFSGTENGASIEAADVAVLGHGIEKLFELFAVSHRTVQIARESIYGGIALSVIGMTAAAFGFLTPAYGAFIQEAIDVVVILNALRVLRG